MKLSKDKWSKDITDDGYHVRAGQNVFVKKEILPFGCVGHCEKIEGVDSNGNAYSAYRASAWGDKPISLKDCVIKY